MTNLPLTWKWRTATEGTEVWQHDIKKNVFNYPCLNREEQWRPENFLIWELDKNHTFFIVQQKVFKGIKIHLGFMNHKDDIKQTGSIATTASLIMYT